MPHPSPQGTSQADRQDNPAHRGFSPLTGPHIHPAPPGQKGWRLEGLSLGHHRVSRTSG